MSIGLPGWDDSSGRMAAMKGLHTEAAWTPVQAQQHADAIDQQQAGAIERPAVGQQGSSADVVTLCQLLTSYRHHC